MKQILFYLVFTALLSGVQVLNAQEAQYPVIKGYGGAYKVPEAKVFPDKNLDNRILFDITKMAPSPDQINTGLEHVAMFLNVYSLYGIQPGDMTVAAVIHSNAISLALSDEKYQEVTGHKNPNSELIRELLDHGVKIFVCSQSLMQNKYNPEWVNKRMVISAAAFNVLVNDQLEGYALLSY